MKKLTMIIFMMFITVALFSGGQAEDPSKLPKSPRKKWHYSVGGAGLLVNSIAVEGFDDPLTTLSFGLNSSTAPYHFGYMGNTVGSVSIYTTDGSETSYANMPVFALDNIIGAGYGFNIGTTTLSIGGGVHLGIVNYSYWDSDESESFFSAGPAFMISTNNNKGLGMMIEFHYDSLYLFGSSEYYGLKRCGISFMTGISPY